MFSEANGRAEYSHKREDQWKGGHKRANHGNGRIANGEGCRFKRFEVGGGKSESENIATNLGTVPGGSKGSCSIQIRPTRNYIEKGRLVCDRRNRPFYDEYANKDWPYNPSVDYSERRFRGNTIPKAPETNEANISFMGGGGMGENNGVRAPPDLTNGPNVPNAKPEISLLNMTHGEKDRSEPPHYLGAIRSDHSHGRRIHSPSP